jgi:hypothetical protein
MVAMKKFSPLDLSAYFNTGRGNAVYKNQSLWHRAIQPLLLQLPGGQQTFWGIPFLLGKKEGKRSWIVLGAHQNSVTVTVEKQATYVVFAHFADSSNKPEDRGPSLDGEVGYVQRPGELLANYALIYTDRSEVCQPIRRRFEINDACITWGHLAFASRSHNVVEPLDLRGPYPGNLWGLYQTGKDLGEYKTPVHYWLYALSNPHPEKQLASIRMEASGSGHLAVAGITLYHGREHPLRHQRLEAVRITLPDEELSRIENIKLEIDQGIIARTYSVPSIDSEAWLNALPKGCGEAPEQPQPVKQFVAEITASPDALLKVAKHEVELKDLYTEGKSKSRDGKVCIEVLTPHKTWLDVTIEDSSTGLPTPARVHFRASDGRYLPPYGHRHEVNDGWFEDYGADLKLGNTQYAYVDGTFRIELPVGDVYVELSKGFEYSPVRQKLTIQPGQRELKLRIERPVNWRSNGWVTADTHVHFISPETAVLQAQGEGINLVNLLASQWGDLFTNVGDITGSVSGTSRNDTIVWVGTENRQHILGHISLLGTKGMPVFPMCAGGPDESYIGDPTWMSLAEWADQCRQKEGVVISPHFPNPLCEVVADIILGKVDGVEIRDFYAPKLDTFSITEWYRFLNLGYHLAAVGGTDKMSAGIPVGGVRTYAQIEDRDFTFENWGKAVRAGRTFTTSGPLLELKVEGQPLGVEIRLPKGGGTLDVEARALSTQPFHELQIVVNGAIVARETAGAGSLSTVLHTQLRFEKSSWIAARCLSRLKVWFYEPVFMAAHTSPIYIQVEENELFNPSDAMYMHTLLEGGLAWLETLSIPADPMRQARVRSVFEAAQERLSEPRYPHPHPD